MSSVKCFDAMNSVIELANERFGQFWVLDPEKLDILHEYCDAIDLLVKAFDGISFDVEIDDAKYIVIELECPDAVIESKDHVFYELLQRTVRHEFFVSKEGNLVIKFVFPPIWNRAPIGGISK